MYADLAARVEACVPGASLNTSTQQQSLPQTPPALFTLVVVVVLGACGIHAVCFVLRKPAIQLQYGSMAATSRSGGV